MGKYVRQLAYKGKDIIFMDARGVNEEEGIAAWEEMRQELLNKQGATGHPKPASEGRVKTGQLR